MSADPTTSLSGPSVAEIIDLISSVERQLAARITVVLEAEGCDIARWRALRLLSDGEGHAMSELIAHTLLAPPTATRLVDGMVADNLAHRVVDDRDRRRVLVHATARGRAMQARLAQLIEAAADDVLPQRLDPALVGGLRTLVSHP